MSCSGRRHTPGDLSLAEDLVARAASAADNALLYQSIQEADRRKNEFLAMLGHELRNPLAPIRNAVGMIRLLGVKDPLLLQARDMIDRQVTHMTRLIDDLLDMSRISRGRILLRKEPLDLVQLVSAVMEDYRGSLETAGLKLHVSLPDTPLWVQADATRLAQVVGNILHNARKFTDAGGAITVELDTTPSGARLLVSDTGIGMDPTMVDRAFEAFSQADRSLDRTQGGLGLGLALVKGLVDLHGGQVEAHSAGLGSGTEVAITLPLVDPPTGAIPAVSARHARNSAHRVLVIEDNRDAAQSLEMLLTLLGHRVAVAFTGQDGVSCAREFEPDVVLCDIGLPGGMDGLDVARSLRGELALKSAYLVALTGYGQEIDKQRSRDAGFDIHLTKPIDLHELQGVFATVPVRN
jgi:CheY-like chemotaxis protein/two-component sensor histidine kinase